MSQYKTYDVKLLTIIEAFKTERYILKNCKYEVFILTNYNNLYQFIDRKNFSFKQVCWVQKFFKYDFIIDYQQNKANKAANILSRFPQRSSDKEKKLSIKNTQIFYFLQISLTRASLSNFNSFKPDFLLFYQIIICNIHMIFQLCQF